MSQQRVPDRLRSPAVRSPKLTDFSLFGERMDRQARRDKHTALRRTQSVSSVRDSTFGNACKAPINDLVFNRLQAETAACEAYRRSHEHENGRKQMVRVSSKRLQQRHKLEGSHLEDARLGRRKSVARAATNKRSLAETSHAHGLLATELSPETAISSPSNNKTSHEHILAERRKQISRRSDPAVTTPRQMLTVTAQGSPETRRKPASVYADALEPRSTHVQEFSYEACPQAEKLSIVDSSHQLSSAMQQAPSPRSVVQSSSVQHDKVRNRRSFLLVPVHKLRKRSSTILAIRPFHHDPTVPPFNLAEHGHTRAPSFAGPTDQDAVNIPEPPAQPGKARLLSTAVKSRIKHFMRRSSRTGGELPPQHIPAKQLHYGNKDSLSSKLSASIGADNDESSRVTSWTNSTVTQATRAESTFGRGEQVSEYGMLQRTGGDHRLRSRSSFFGQSVQNKLRKSSRSNLHTSKESQGLYTALQKLIQSSDSKLNSADGEPPNTSAVETATEIAGIPLPPSPRQLRQEARRSAQYTPSIRAVTPDRDLGYGLSMSPVLEVLSPAGSTAGELIGPALAADQSRPSPEQVARRVEAYQNRWQNALDTGYPARHDQGSNPYELSATVQHLIGHHHGAGTAFQDETTIVDPRLTDSALSPSIYSRASDGTPHVASPEKTTRTSIKITGREVRSYKISPTKSDRVVSEEQPTKVSSEWTRWLSDELRDLSCAPVTAVASAPNASASTNSSSSLPGSASEALHDIWSGVVQHTDSAESNCRHPRKRRPQASNRRLSSFMNDRYPVIESSRPSSRQSGRTRKNGALQGTGKISEPATSQAIGRHKSSADASSMRVSHDKALAEPDEKLPEQIMGSTSATSETKRPHSSFELRAHFKSSLSTKARPLGIQRKSASNILSMPNDDTLRQISAGPYASELQSECSLGRENKPPAKFIDDPLPARSSSEWLTGPSAKGKEQTDMHSTGCNMMSSLSSRTEKSSSPGQRLAAGWLKGRSPASSGVRNMFV